MSNNTSGPAFPNEGFNGWGQPQQGMTLRDYFAAKAMQGAVMQGWDNRFISMTDVARDAYKIADAMLETREQ